MLIRSWDAALDDEEWRTWPADGHDLGQPAVDGLPGRPPTVIPTHVSVEDTPTGTDPLVHLARPDRGGGPPWTPTPTSSWPWAGTSVGADHSSARTTPE